jgi:hypothetical protein
MEYTVGQALKWTPVYFRWDEPKDVTVVKVYPRGYALLSNNRIVDDDGLADWHGRIAGKVEE